MVEQYSVGEKFTINVKESLCGLLIRCQHYVMRLDVNGNVKNIYR